MTDHIEKHHVPHTTGKRLYADGHQPSAYVDKPSAYWCADGGRRRRAVGVSPVGVADLAVGASPTVGVYSMPTVFLRP
jgi:hypothetical protein